MKLKSTELNKAILSIRRARKVKMNVQTENIGTKKKKQEDRENYTMRGFIICTLNLSLLR